MRPHASLCCRVRVAAAVVWPCARFRHADSDSDSDGGEGDKNNPLKIIAKGLTNKDKRAKKDPLMLHQWMAAAGTLIS